MNHKNPYTVDWKTLPKPLDDGAAKHLLEHTLPDLTLPAHNGAWVQLSSLSGWGVLYVYPKMAAADGAVPEGWDMIPGARGCTPQACAFRDHYQELKALGLSHIFGLSSQTREEQKQAATRLHLPFLLLSDADRKMLGSLKLPSFKCAGETLFKRLTLILQDSTIRHVMYPIFPPDQNADEVIAWCSTNIH